MEKKKAGYQIIFENESILVINKPAEVHSTFGKNSENTIAEFIKNSYPQNLLINEEGGLLQRLDYETSGCFLVAKTIPAFNFFKEKIKNHQLAKEYLFLSERGISQPTWVKNYLYSRYRGSKKISISEDPIPRALYAETLFSVEQEIISKKLYLIKAQTCFGRRHQVRAQAGFLNIPLLGDSLYGSDKSFSNYDLNEFPKFLLHGLALKVPKNSYCNKTEFTASIPSYLAEFIKNH